MSDRDVGLARETVDALSGWIEHISAYPGFREWKRRSISLVLHDLRLPSDSEHPAEFVFASHVERQHSAVMSFLALQTTWLALADCEFYLRNYPGLPVTKEAHLRYCIEMFFSRIYEFSEKMKKCLNAMNLTLDEGKLDVGKIVKEYAKEFRQELAARNSVHHNFHFSDLMLDRVAITGLVADHKDHGRGWASEQRVAYRKTQRDWVNRIRRRTKRVKVFLGAVEVAMVNECNWLNEPIDPEKA
jgi:hypothetical protein